MGTLITATQPVSSQLGQWTGDDVGKDVSLRCCHRFKRRGGARTHRVHPGSPAEYPVGHRSGLCHRHLEHSGHDQIQRADLRLTRPHR